MGGSLKYSSRSPGFLSGFSLSVPEPLQFSNMLVLIPLYPLPQTNDKWWHSFYYLCHLPGEFSWEKTTYTGWSCFSGLFHHRSESFTLEIDLKIQSVSFRWFFSLPVEVYWFEFLVANKTTEWMVCVFVCVCVCMSACELSHVWVFVTPWTVARQAPLSMGFSRQEYCSGLPFPSSGHLPDPGFKPASLEPSALAHGFFTTAPTGKPWNGCRWYEWFGKQIEIKRGKTWPDLALTPAILGYSCWCGCPSVQFSSVAQLCLTLWTAACQASLSITNSQSLLKLISSESVMPSNHLILCYPLHLPPSIIPSISVISNESVLCIRWPKYWSFSFSIRPSNEYSRLISFKMDWLDLLAVQGTLKSLHQHHRGRVYEKAGQRVQSFKW